MVVQHMPAAVSGRGLSSWFPAFLLAGSLMAFCANCRAVDRSTRDGYMLAGWNIEDGLVAGNINAVDRARNGFLWLGTDLGLIRFDGDRFWALDTNRFPVSIEDRVNCLLTDRRGMVWAGTMQGALLVGDGRGFKIVELPSPRPGPLNSMVEDAAGDLWLATGGAGVAIRQKGVWRMSGTTNGLPSNDVRQIVLDSTGRVWAVSGGRVLLWAEDRWRGLRESMPSGQAVTTICAGPDGSLWVATMVSASYRGARIFKIQNERWIEESTPYPWPQDSARSAIRTLLTDAAGQLWVNTSGGGIFRKQGVSPWQSLQQGPLAHEMVNTMAFDQEGSLWFGLQGGQLFQAHPQGVSTLRLNVPNEQDIVEGVCVSHDGSVWAGTYGAGAYCLRNGLWNRYANEQGLANLYVFSMIEDSRSNLWAGTRNGLFHFNEGRFETCPLVTTNLPVLSLLETRDGAIWLGGNRDVRRMKDGRVKIFGSAEGISIARDIRAMAEDSEGRLWVSVRQAGLFRQVDDGRFERYRADLWPRGVDIRVLCFDESGALWMATFGDGLYRLKNGQVRRWTMREGVPSDYCLGMIQDTSGRFWMSTLNGIFGFTSQAMDNASQSGMPLLGRHLSTSEGLDGLVCSGWGQPVAARSPDGRLWFPNQRVVAVFNPDAVVERGPSWPPTIDEVRADGVAQVIDSSGMVRILSGTRQVEFAYTVPNLLSPGRFRFRHRLQGLEDGWTDAQRQRTAHYSHLDPGRYEFSVMACGPEGEWQEMKYPVVLLVTPQLWERTPVRVMAALLFLGAVGAGAWIVSRMRMRGKLLRLEAQQAAELERRRIARDLHDELGSGLTEIMLLGDLGFQQGIPDGDARNNAASIAGKTRQLASALDEIVWTTNPKNDVLPRMTGYLCDHAQQFLRATTVRCRLDVEDFPEEIRLNATLRHNLLLAYKEALRNAVRHSGAAEIAIRMRFESGRLAIEVKDDGRGFDPASVCGLRNGLQNMKDRMEAIGGQLVIRSRPGQGTLVKFELDLRRNYPMEQCARSRAQQH